MYAYIYIYIYVYIHVYIYMEILLFPRFSVTPQGAGVIVLTLGGSLKKCHEGFPGLFVKFRGGHIKALGLAQ